MIEQARFKFRQNRGSGCTLVSVRHLVPKERPTTAEAINPRYEFDLVRHDPLAAWAITRTDLISNGRSSARDCMSNRALDYWPQRALLLLHTYDLLPFLIEQVEFTVHSVNPVTVGTSELAKVEFEYQPKDSKGVNTGDLSPVKAGWVLLDPNRYWLIHKFEAQVEYPGLWKGPIEGYVEYDASQVVPIPKKRILKQKRMNSDGSLGEYESRFEFEMTEAEAPESEFYLSAFGLPEPILATPRPTRWYLWGALAAGLCLLLAVLLRWRAKRSCWTTISPDKI